ncbi:MAG: alpha/beta fold hydrolase [Bacteroidetes bacterium]|nr:alpha/beta fold hydrolase [Bacteroidota bacterium]
MNTLILLHGALGSASMFEKLIPYLQDEFTCIALDFPAHGNNAEMGEFTIQAFAENLIAYIEQNHTQKVSVFGYSMGGYCALYAASLRPDLFEKVMTLATKFAWSNEIAHKEMAMLDAEKMEAKIPEFVKQLQQQHLHTHWKELVLQTTFLLRELGNHPLLTDDCLQSIRIPVRMVLGDHDQMVSIEETVHAYRQFQNGSLVILPNTKHPYEKVDTLMLAMQIIGFF